MFTVAEKLKILPIKILIAVVWGIDRLGNLPESIAVNSARVAVVAIFVSFFYSGTATHKVYLDFANSVRTIPLAVFYSIYGPPSYEFNNKNVLGALAQKEVPYQVEEIPYPIITARAALVADVSSGKTLFNLNSDLRLAPASTTKLMTALVAVDYYEPEEVLTVPPHCTTVDGQKAGLYSGESVLVFDLLNTLLITSAGDSACVLATTRVSYDDFVEFMNHKAVELGMNDTHFTNPIGFDGVDSTHYSTANDLYKLAVRSMEKELISESVKLTEYAFNSRTVYNTNRLLWEIPETSGIKTGTTAEAGEVLIYSFQDDEKNIIIIVMGSLNRFSDTRALLYWTLESFSWE
jgi:serine-type D-Ala-D-Ala carboxypeptidase (penicillin-binding protein 5/6)